jgi:hypothetical protein
VAEFEAAIVRAGADGFFHKSVDELLAREPAAN